MWLYDSSKFYASGGMRVELAIMLLWSSGLCESESSISEVLYLISLGVRRVYWSPMCSVCFLQDDGESFDASWLWIMRCNFSLGVGSFISCSIVALVSRGWVRVMRLNFMPCCNLSAWNQIVLFVAVLSMADGGPWQRAKNLPYRPTCGAAISEYGGVVPPYFPNLAMVKSQKQRHQYLLWRRHGWYLTTLVFGVACFGQDV